MWMVKVKRGKHGKKGRRNEEGVSERKKAYTLERKRKNEQVIREKGEERRKCVR